MAGQNALLEPKRSGDLKRHFGRVDGVVGTVHQGHLHIHDGIAGHDAFPHGLDDALFNGRPILLGNDAADDLVDELKPAAPGQGFDIEPAIAELAPAARLLLVAALDIGLALDGLLVGDLGDLEVDLHPEFPFHFLHGDFDVDLPHPGENHFLGLFLPAEVQRGVLFRQAVDRGDDLVLVAPRFRLDGKGHDRRGDFQFVEQDGRLLVADRVPCRRFLQFCQDGDIPGDEDFGGFLVFSLQEKGIAEALGQLSVGVVYASLGTEGARIDAEKGKPSRIGVGNCLEDHGGKGFRCLRTPLLHFFFPRLLSGNRAPVHG